MTYLFLHSELAEYTIACLRALKVANCNNRVVVVHFPINPEAPFRFELDDIGKFICVDDFRDYRSFEKALSDFDTDVIVCSGWINKWYVRFCSHWRNRSFCILASDNIWKNSLKQQLFVPLARIPASRIFKRIWVPGRPQVQYAHKLGFDNSRILTGYYSCDTDRFDSLFQRFEEAKKSHFPRRFLCVARYIPVKNYNFLWDAFVEWKAMQDNDWELWCAGSGPQFAERIDHSAIKHLGFVQKTEWDDVVANTGVFVLPSKFEPWGVALHEFSACGYPVVASKYVGAASLFVKERNGYLFDAGSKEDLIRCFEGIAKSTDDGLFEMAVESNRLSKQITPVLWARTLIEAYTKSEYTSNSSNT